MNYISKRDNITEIKVLKYDDKSCTYQVRFLNGNRQGQVVVYSSGTIKRWWKKMEETIEKENKPTNEQVNESVPNVKNKKENKIEGTKETKEKDFDKLESFITHTFNNSYYESVKCYKIKKSSKTVGEIYLRKKHIEVRVKSVQDHINVPYKDGYKYYLPVHYFISYDSDYLKIIEQLLV